MDVAMAVLGAVLVTYGWYWAGVTESRTTAYAMGAGAIMLGLGFAFGGGSPLIALGAIFALLGTMNAWNESSQDRTYGMFALLLAVIALLAYGNDDGLGYGVLALGAIAALHFVSAALVPANKGFKALIGWATLFAGAVIVFVALEDFTGIAIG